MTGHRHRSLLRPRSSSSSATCGATASRPSPGQIDVRMQRAVKHAQHGVLAWRVTTSPAHGHPHERPHPPDPEGRRPGRRLARPPLRQRRRRSTSPRRAGRSSRPPTSRPPSPAVQDGDIVVIVTGWHHKYSDGLEYFGEAPGPLQRRRRVARRRRTRRSWPSTRRSSTIPLATSMGPHRGGPQMKRLAGEYAEATGLDPKKEHPEWNVAHKTLAGRRHPDDRAGRRRRGPPQGQARHPGRDPLEVRARGRLPGPDGRHARPVRQAAASTPATDHPRSRKEPDMALKIYNLSHTFTQFMPGVAVHSERQRQGRASSTPRTASTRWSGKASCTAARTWTRRSTSPRTRRASPTTRCGACSAPASASIIPKEQVGSHHARGPRERDAQDRRGRHRHDQHRLPSPVGRHRRVLRLRLRHRRRGRPVAGRQEGQDGGLRLPGQRPPHRHQARRPRPRPDTAAPHRRVQGRDRPRPQGGLPELGAGAQDPHVSRAASPASRTSAATWTRSPASAARSWRCPWRWPGGDGCMVRMLAVIDPDQTFRFETGQ